jgi:hypothetical protein
MYTAFSQAPFTTSEYVDMNKIKASVSVHGDFGVNYATGMPGCEFPKGSGNHISYGGGIWMAAYDAQGSLHASAQTYRQNGNDYWPGPLNNTGALNYATSTDWARIWKVNKTDISTFLSTTPHTPANTPAAILEWPAKGNPNAKGNNGASLTINSNMAPFVDVNGDQKYNALDGDYPVIKGDQFLWWVFSDNGPTHNASGFSAMPLQVEVHACSYAFSNGQTQDNIVYYEYDIINKSGRDLDSMCFGYFNDISIGDDNDDYAGFDSSRRLGIGYNANSIDSKYGSNIPVSGITFLKVPGDGNGNYEPLGSFLAYYNQGSSFPTGNPEAANDYNNYMRATWKDGMHLKNDYTPGIVSYGRSGTDANYMFDGDPSIMTQWSECGARNPIGDRRYAISTGDFKLAANATTRIAYALVAADPAPSGCPNTNFAEIKRVADTAWDVYNTLPPLAVNSVAASKRFRAYPNPATQVFYLESDAPFQTSIQVYDAIGRKMDVKQNVRNGKIELDIQTLPSGMYYANCRLDRMNETVRFMKQ